MVEEMIDTRGIEKLEPIPIKLLRGLLMATDGHTRGVALHRRGHEEVKCCWEDTKLDWRAYSICVDWCLEEGITSMLDLNNRIVNHDDFETLWLERCRVMHEELTSDNTEQ